MVSNFVIIRILISFLLLIVPDNNTNGIKVAIVPYKPFRDYYSTTLQIMFQNVEEYIKCIEMAFPKKVDLIIFPEYGLTTDECLEWSHPSSAAIDLQSQLNKIPCNHQQGVNEILIKISCSAIEHKVHVVLSLLEHTEDKPYFSTVVFDNEGVLKNIYRKKNLAPPEIEEYYKSENKSDTIVEINGENFLILSGFDPFLAISQNNIFKNISGIITTSSIKSEYPFVHGPSLFYAYSTSNNIPLFVASLEGSTYHGSGIYDKTFYVAKGDQLMISNDRIKRSEALTQENQKFTYSFKNYKHCIHELTNTTDNCDVSVTFKNNSDESKYKKVICLNENIFRNITAGKNANISLCSLVYCPNQDCEIDNKFSHSILITGVRIELKNNRPIIQALPITLTSTMLPVENLNQEKGKNNFIISSTNQHNLISFGVLLITSNSETSSNGDSTSESNDTKRNSCAVNHNIFQIFPFLLYTVFKSLYFF